MLTHAPKFSEWIKQPLRAVFENGPDKMICTKAALEQGDVPADIRPPAAEIKKALDALTLKSR